MRHIMIITLIAFMFNNCISGDVDIGVSDEIVELIEGITDSETDNDSSSGGSGDSNGRNGVDSDDESSEDSSEVSLEYVGNSFKGDNRTFVGTFTLDTIWSGCTTTINIPYNTRVYSHGDALDFEDSQGDLAWIAEVYEDDTFDFSLPFNDVFGRAKFEMACTCFIEEGGVRYNDEINCNCAGDGETCELYYDKL